LEDSFLAATFTPAGLSSNNLKGLAPTMEVYLLDVNQQEPAILQLYGKVIPEVNSALSHCWLLQISESQRSCRAGSSRRSSEQAEGRRGDRRRQLLSVSTFLCAL
jgi:hypothetical protein